MLYSFLLYSKLNQLYVYLHLLFSGFPYHLGHHRALSTSLGSIVSSSILSIVSIVYICQFQSPHSSRTPFFPWYTHICSLHLYLYFSFANKFICIIFLDSTFKWCYMILIFLFLTSLYIRVSRFTHVSAKAQFCSLLWMSNILLYTCTTSSSSVSLLMDI